MNKDTPIFLVSAEILALALIDYFSVLSFASAISVMIIGAIYMVWSMEK